MLTRGQQGLLRLQFLVLHSWERVFLFIYCGGGLCTFYCFLRVCLEFQQASTFSVCVMCFLVLKSCPEVDP